MRPAADCSPASIVRVVAWLPTAAIAVQLALMLILVWWNYHDARLESEDFSQALLLRASDSSNFLSVPSRMAWLLCIILWLAFLTFAFSATALVWAGQRHRSIRYAGLLCAILALWLAIGTQWKSIAWLGHRNRARVVVEQLRPIASELQEDWPRSDGVRPSLGPFMAYPNGKPRTLILLTPVPMGNQFGALAAIDRDSGGSLRFEFSRGVDSLWLEWSTYQDGATPQFTSGVGATYQLTDSISVDKNWRVSRFD